MKQAIVGILSLVVLGIFIFICWFVHEHSCEINGKQLWIRNEKNKNYLIDAFGMRESRVFLKREFYREIVYTRCKLVIKYRDDILKDLENNNNIEIRNPMLGKLCAVHKFEPEDIYRRWKIDFFLCII